MRKCLDGLIIGRTRSPANDGSFRCARISMVYSSSGFLHVTYRHGMRGVSRGGRVSTLQGWRVEGSFTCIGNRDLWINFRRAGYGGLERSELSWQTCRFAIARIVRKAERGSLVAFCRLFGSEAGKTRRSPDHELQSNRIKGLRAFKKSKDFLAKFLRCACQLGFTRFAIAFSDSSSIFPSFSSLSLLVFLVWIQKWIAILN